MEGCSPRSGPQRDTIFVPALEVNSEQDHSLPPAERPPETLEPGMGARCPGTALDEFSSPRKVTKPALSGRRRHHRYKWDERIPKGYDSREEQRVAGCGVRLWHWAAGAAARS